MSAGYLLCGKHISKIPETLENNPQNRSADGNSTSEQQDTERAETKDKYPSIIHLPYNLISDE